MYPIFITIKVSLEDMKNKTKGKAARSTRKTLVQDKNICDNTSQVSEECNCDNHNHHLQK